MVEGEGGGGGVGSVCSAVTALFSRLVNGPCSQDMTKHWF